MADINLVRVSVKDEALNKLDYYAEAYPVFYKRALKSLGWYSQQEIKKGIRSGAPGGKKYKDLIKPSKRRQIDKAFRKKTKSRYLPMGRLRNAVGYDTKEVNRGIVTVGWLSRTAVRIGSIMENGIYYYVTPKMRKALLRGRIYTNKKIIEIPARPTFGPMTVVLEPKLVNYLNGKVEQFIQNPNLRGTKSSNRRYRVYKPEITGGL
ncbi:hypothetical protein [Megamonas funiformis]|uniref:hypothetical protein n=1 Tax=Megamonas funiformis TaxID=437897 RepID=UPI004027FDAE